MLGVFLLLVVILNAFCTGWLLSEVRKVKRAVSTNARVMQEVVSIPYGPAKDGEEVEG